jgi:hypothetical protein
VQDKLKFLANDNADLKRQLELFKQQRDDLTCKNMELERNLKRLQNESANLGKDANKLLLANNHNAKTQFLDKQRAELD